ncbi:MAG: hypothetical protein CSA54_01235 [Gammaproteobacteria bacterium]|nr:MAG: hypothetical protein CSA54_01235 [Gammaproteobacteria bacterium]
MSDDQRNKREYFRVTDEVAIHHKPLGLKNASELELIFENRRQDFSLMSHLYYMRDRYTPQMRRIEQTSPSTAEYLRMLEKQIDALCTRIVQQSERLDSTHTVIADISATGICFPSRLEYQPDDMMELAIMLFPSHTVFVTFARAVRSIPVANSKGRRGWEVAANFEYLHPEDQENLIKHVHQVQMESLRERANSVYRDRE